MENSNIISQARQELINMENRLTQQLADRSYNTLAHDLARVCCRVSCAIANRDEKGITQIKWRQQQRELKQALKEQNQIIREIFNQVFE